jgi:predicted dehydrogenase
MPRYRTVLVGCGARGAMHARGILANPERLALVAVCDLDAARLTPFAAQFGIHKTYTNADAMLAAEQPDILCFATMPQIRLSLVELGVKHGVKAISFEKPMALSLAEARQIVDLCAAAGIKMIVCHQLKYGTHWRKAHEIIHSSDIGEVQTIYATARPSMLRVGTHLVDAMLWLNGGHGASWVIGQAHGTAAYGEDHPCPDYLSGIIQFTNGVRGMFECGTLAPHFMAEENFWEDCGVTVYGTHGYVRTVLGAGWQALTRSSGGSVLCGPPDLPTQEPFHMQALADWLDHPQQVHPCHGEVSYAGFELLIGMALSSLERRRVDIPITPLPITPVLPRLQQALTVAPKDGLA